MTDQQCRKCGGTMKPGKALAQTVVAGIPDFGPDDEITTFSAGGPGKMIDCLKCEQCGWSVTKAPDRIWHDGVTQHARELRWEAPTSDLHPQNEYVRADLRPVVKALEWYDSPDDDTDFCADALGLTYIADCDLDGFCSWGFFRHIGREEGCDDWTIDDAKAAAQADYEKRILSALDLAPVTPAQAAKEALINAAYDIEKRAEEIVQKHLAVSAFNELRDVAKGLRAIAEGGA